jgi:hypothetical protein
LRSPDADRETALEGARNLVRDAIERQGSDRGELC